MDNQADCEAVKTREKCKCKLVDRRVLLTGIMAPWFCASKDIAVITQLYYQVYTLIQVIALCYIMSI